jgi:hypothetical protein
MVAGAFAVAALMVITSMARPAPSALAAFHCMRIHAVMSGFNTNDNVQFVELRMSSGGQTALAGHKMQFRDAAGTLQAEFTFPGNVANGLKGDSILIATAEYNDNYSPGHDADFEFSLANTTGADPLTPVQGPGGKVTFEPTANCSFTGSPVDSVAYGSGAVTADFGSKAVALPAPTTNQGLQLNNLALAPSNNSTEYALMTASSTSEAIAGVAATLEADKRFPRNNARILSAVGEPPGVGGMITEPEVTSGAAAAAESEGRAAATVIAITAAVVAAATALGALEWRRRRRA